MFFFSCFEVEQSLLMANGDNVKFSKIYLHWALVGHCPQINPDDKMSEYSFTLLFESLTVRIFLHIFISIIVNK